MGTPVIPEPVGSPGVTLDWSLWCARHLEPYRARWPEGAAPAMVMLFKAATQMPAVIDAAKDKPTDELANAANLTRVLRRFSPVCCFIPREEMARIHAETVPGLAGRQN